MSKYDALKEHLERHSFRTWDAHFKEIEQILGFGLPKSARLYPAWWSNQEPPSSQSSSWVEAGWVTANVDLSSDKVRFERTGIFVQDKNESAPRPAVPVNTTKRALEPKAANASFDWETPEILTVLVEAVWKPHGRAVFDHARCLVFPDLPMEPGIYRIRIRRDGAESRYIGETSNLKQRFVSYRNPGPTQATNLRLKAMIVEALQAGAEVSISVLEASAVLNIGASNQRADLASKPVRRLIENAALVAGGGVEIEELNR